MKLYYYARMVFWSNLNEETYQALFDCARIDTCLKKFVKTWKKNGDGTLDNMTAIFARR